MAQECIFCGIAAGKIPATIVHQDDRVVAFEDLNPAAPVHVLIIPRRHVATVNAVEPDDAPDLGHLFSVAREVAAAKGVAEDGYRLTVNCNAAAGQTVFHLHVHLLGGRSLGWPPG